jgi:hypothetical protein
MHAAGHYSSYEQGRTDSGEFALWPDAAFSETALSGLSLLVIATTLSACKRGAELAAMSVISLEFISSTQSGINFRLMKQTAQVNSCRGTRKRSVGG